jgi:hypothetical protein
MNDNALVNIEQSIPILKTKENMKVLSFNTTRSEMLTINNIAKRAVAMAEKNGIKYKMMDADMDITACHCNGNRLDLNKLLNADDFNFAHDVFGILHHINRETGQLQNCFVPRCSI